MGAVDLSPFDPRKVGMQMWRVHSKRRARGERRRNVLRIEPANDQSSPEPASSFTAVADLDPNAPDTDNSVVEQRSALRNDQPSNDVAPFPPPANPPKLTRRGRLRKWDRPAPPKDWRWWVGNFGKILIAAGLLMFGFVAYQLWGTGIETARAQNQLESEFDALLADSPPVGAPEFTSGDGSETAPVTTISDSASQPVTAPDPDPDPAGVQVPVEQQNIDINIENGSALARLEIARIGRNDIVVAGVRTNDLKRGPGHFPDTPLPGQLGNSAIAGHRTTYGSPFFDVDDLQPGDEIIATTLNGRFTYRVTGQRVVASNEYWVVATTDPTKATLTLISCDPKYTAQKRIVIFSELVASESSPVGEPILNYGRPQEPAGPIGESPEIDPGTNAPSDIEQLDPEQFAEAQPADEPLEGDASVVDSNDSITIDLGDTPLESDDEVLGTDAVNEGLADAFSEGWFSDPSANGQVGIWGVALSVIAAGAYLISRKLRRDWAGALIGLLPFIVALYFFFQNVNRLLPPNL
ncbi:MAG: sortase A [Gammaproteobacteria bacterium]|jgi:sortase A